MPLSSSPPKNYFWGGLEGGRNPSDVFVLTQKKKGQAVMPSTPKEILPSSKQLCNSFENTLSKIICPNCHSKEAFSRDNSLFHLKPCFEAKIKSFLCKKCRTRFKKPGLSILQLFKIVSNNSFAITAKYFAAEKIASMHSRLSVDCDEKLCQQCMNTDNTVKNGTYSRYHPENNTKIQVQRHFCKKCKKSFSNPAFSILRLYRLTLEGLFLILMLFDICTVSLLAEIFDCARSTIKRRYHRWEKIIFNSLEIEPISWGSFIFSVSHILFPRFYPS